MTIHLNLILLKKQTLKYFFFYIGILFCYSPKVNSQEINYKTILSPQIDLSNIKSKQQIASILVGIKAKDSSQILIGPFIKYFNQEIGHNKIHSGIKVFAQRRIIQNWYLGITANYVINGQFYVSDNRQIISISKTSMLGGAFSIIYEVKKNIFVHTSISFSDYQPINYYMSKTSPFGTNFGNIGLSYNIDISNKSLN
jgi:hypothetical protein